MLELNQIQVSLLDCTLRDGGYYTDWDFDDNIVDEYFETMNRLPIDFIEIGYRSKFKVEYAGAYYYLPEFILKDIKRKTNKQLAIILNEKEILIEDLESLLKPCEGLVAMVRLAVDPQNFKRAVILANKIKTLGFLVSFNLMYASRWETDFKLDKRLNELNNAADYFYVVDSYGGLYPQQVSDIFKKLKQHLNIPLGFHGHNNLEMALVNSLAALESGAGIIDSTICGMGRGAGNLKTELWLSILHQQHGISVDFDALNSLTNSFTALNEKYKWGTNLPYMVSGAFSLPQDTVMSQVKKRYYSLNAIIEEVGQTGISELSETGFPKFGNFKMADKVLLVGGGNSALKFSSALVEFLRMNPEICIIYASSKNVAVFSELPNLQIHCLSGSEGKRLEKSFKFEVLENRIFVVLPKNISVYNYVSEAYLENTFQLEEINFIDSFKISTTAMAIQIAVQLMAKELFLTGYDGYGEAVTKDQLELFEENQLIFDHLKDDQPELNSLTPTLYAIPSKSIFSLI